MSEMKELADLIFDDEGWQIQSKSEEWSVTSYGKANWVSSRITQSNQRIAQVIALAREYHAKIDAWAAKATKEDQDSIEFFTGALRDFVAKQLTGKVRHITLLELEAGFRKTPGRTEIVDEPLALAWAKENLPEAVKVTETLQKTPLKKHIETTGELPPGVQLMEGMDVFYIRPTKEGLNG